MTARWYGHRVTQAGWSALRGNERLQQQRQVKCKQESRSA